MIKSNSPPPPIGNECQMEAQDTGFAKNVSWFKYGHEEVHHRCAEGEREGGANQDHQICWLASKLNLFMAIVDLGMSWFKMVQITLLPYTEYKESMFPNSTKL